MKSPLHLFVAAIILCFVGFPLTTHARGIACATSTDYVPVEERPQKSMAYRITDCQGHESILLGTLHSSDPALIATTDHLIPALDKSKEAWFELVKQLDDEKLVASRMFLPANESQGLKEMLGAKDFATLMQRITAKIPSLPEAYVNRYQPWAAGVILETLSIETSGVVMDDVLQQRAVTKKIPVHALETMEHQFSVFERFSLAEQLAMLRQSLVSFEENEAIAKELEQSYLSGDLVGIATLSAKTFDKMPDPVIREKLEKWLVTDRNARMAANLLPVLQRGGAFIAVGALHLPDETGLLAAFERAGFGVYAVSR
jgi:uncharacterized protein